MRPLIPRSAPLLLSAFAVAYFVRTSFLPGWRHQTTDFPNYYTAAVLVRKGQPLRTFYDWTSFQRQMDFAGFERQLGAYTPQTPLTMLPFLPLAGFPPQTAKRLWLIANLGFFSVSLWLLSRLTRLRFEYLLLLTAVGYTSIHTNFLLGQYYTFLLFLLTVACYLLKNSPAASGSAAGLAFALKLYSGPLLAYFIAKQKTRAAGAFLLVATLGLTAMIAIFGWRDVVFYITGILPRTLEGSSVDPYHPANQTISTMLRRLFVPDSQLNPTPLFNAPGMFYFLQPFIALSLVVLTAIAVTGRRNSGDLQGFAMFIIVAILVSTSVASYTFVLLVLPVGLCIDRSRPFASAFVAASYGAINAPVPASALFPKVWLLLALLAVVGWPYWRTVRVQVVLAALLVTAVVASASMQRGLKSYYEQPAQHFERLRTPSDSLFNGYPMIVRQGLFFQAMGADRYVLRWMHDHRFEDILLDGDAFRPAAFAADGPVFFELVSHGRSQTMRFDPSTRSVSVASTPLNLDRSGVVRSPDAKWIVFESSENGPRYLSVRNVATGRTVRLTGGNCNSWCPAWELDSSAIVFASDCGRSIGLPSLYRAPVAAFE
jgi:hypothetical protein